MKYALSVKDDKLVDLQRKYRRLMDDYDHLRVANKRILDERNSQIRATEEALTNLSPRNYKSQDIELLIQENYELK